MNIYLDNINYNLETHFQKYFKNETIKSICLFCLKNGKRIRPSISLDICNSLRGNYECAKEASLISEYLHTSSLLIDDLPCMDNAKIRREQECCHIKFGEAATQITSVVFVSLGFDALHRGYVDFPEKERIPEIQNAMSQDIAHIIGSEGIAGGQMMDLSFEKKEIGDLYKEKNESIHLEDVIHKKTGALFELSFVIGWLFGGGSLEKIPNVKILIVECSKLSFEQEDYLKKNSDYFCEKKLWKRF